MLRAMRSPDARIRQWTRPPPCRLLRCCSPFRPRPRQSRSRRHLTGLEPTICRYRDLVCRSSTEKSRSRLGGRFTPLLACGRTLVARLGPRNQCTSLTSRSILTTRSRQLGQSAAASRARRYLGATPSRSRSAGGNAGNAIASYSRRAGATHRWFLPKDVKPRFRARFRLYGADGEPSRAITEAVPRRRRAWRSGSGGTTSHPQGTLAASGGARSEAFELPSNGLAIALLDLYRPGRELHGRDVVRLARKVSTIGWFPSGRRPLMVSVQAEGIRSDRARDRRRRGQGTSLWEGASTIADGWRVPRAIVGLFLSLRGYSSRSGGTALVLFLLLHGRGIFGFSGRLAFLSSAPWLLLPSRGAGRGGGGLVADGRITPHDRSCCSTRGGASNCMYLDILAMSFVNAQFTVAGAKDAYGIVAPGKPRCLTLTFWSGRTLWSQRFPDRDLRDRP